MLRGGGVVVVEEVEEEVVVVRLSRLHFWFVFARSFLHDLSEPSRWEAFLEYMLPCMKRLRASMVIDCILAKTGKRTVILGIDESLLCEESRVPSFFKTLEQLCYCNSHTANELSQTTNVFVFATSLSAFVTRKGWETLSRDTESSARLVEYPLSPLTDHSVWGHILPDYKENEAVGSALVLSGGHPRSIENLVRQLRCEPQSSFTQLVRKYQNCYYSLLWFCYDLVLSSNPISPGQRLATDKHETPTVPSGRVDGTTGYWRQVFSARANYSH